MIIFDTETTGLVSSVESPVRIQPKIIELFALKVDDTTMEEVDQLALLIDPNERLSDEIIKITSITQAMVSGVGSFPTHLPAITEFWLGERCAVGHNVTFDLDMLEVELKRLGAVRRFPWTSEQICTVERTEHLEGRRLNLSDLHTKLFGEGFENAHRAESDVRATHRIAKELRSQGII